MDPTANIYMKLVVTMNVVHRCAPKVSVSLHILQLLTTSSCEDP